MIIALTGTPGTGKTSISKVLAENGFETIDLNKIAQEQGFIIGRDEKRDTNIVDIEKLEDFIKNNYSSKNIVFVEGHLSHLLKCADKIIILRCHPKVLRSNLSIRNWKEKKIRENVEAEILDVILCEALEVHSEEKILEIDVTNKNVYDAASLIIDLTKKGFKNKEKYKIGNIDWSEEILKDF